MSHREPQPSTELIEIELLFSLGLMGIRGLASQSLMGFEVFKIQVADGN